MRNVCVRTIGACLSFRGIQYLLIIIAVMALAAAYGAEYFLKILPCDFCLYERAVYAALIGGGILSLTTSYFGEIRGIIVQLVILSIGIVLTTYHMGLEQHLWLGPASCTSIKGASSLEAFRAQLMNTPRPRCDQINWLIWGVSATSWSLILQAGLAFITSLGFYNIKSIENKN